MHKHPAGPFTVRVELVDLSPGRVGQHSGVVFTSRHRSADGASRRLAQVIARRTKLAASIDRAIPKGFQGRYTIQAGDGQKYALLPFRAKFLTEQAPC